MLDEPLVVAIIVARLFIPLLIPRVPLVIFVVLVLDAVDRRCSRPTPTSTRAETGRTRASTRRSTSTTCRSRTSRRCATGRATRRSGSAQFLFYYRLVGVLAFELTGARAMLLIFPNTFEFFFIAYEVHRGCATTRRACSGAVLAAHRRGALDLRQAPAGVLDPHRATRLHGRGRAITRGSRSLCASLVVAAVPCCCSSCSRGCRRPTGTGGSLPIRCRRRSPRRTRATPGGCEGGRVLTREAAREGVRCWRCCA